MVKFLVSTGVTQVTKTDDTLVKEAVEIGRRRAYGREIGQNDQRRVRA